MISNAALTLTNMGTGAVYETVSTGTGNYTIPSIPSGHYRLAVSAPGFTEFVQEGIQVQVAQTARIDVVLKIGVVTDRVTVVADATLLKTENAEQSHTITGDSINNLPLTLGGNNLYGARNPLAGLMLSPGTYQAVGTNFAFRVNGQTDNLRVLLDGQDITTAGMTSQHLSESHPSVEALQEVTLQSSNFSAEYGQIQGGQVNFTTRSGTNQFHGSGYDYFMNEFLNAGKMYTDDGHGHLVRPRQRNNDYGFTVGGPVRIPKLYDGRNKTFFFWNWDQFRNRAIVSGSITTVPTDAFRTGDMSANLTGRTLQSADALGNPILEGAVYDPSSTRLQGTQLVRTMFPGNRIPQNMFDPVALKIQAMFPEPTNSNLINNFAVLDHTASTTTLPSVKIDHNFSAATHLSFYWGAWINNVPKSGGDGFPFPLSNAREFVTHTNTFRLTIDHTLSPTTLIHLGFGEARYNHLDSNPAPTRDFDAPGKLGLAGGLTNPTGFPSISGLNGTRGGFAGTLGWTNGVADFDDKPTITLTATKVKGNHTLKTGVEWHRDIWTFKQFNTAGGYTFSGNQTGLPYLQTTTVGGGTIGSSYASFLMGLAASASIRNVSDPQVRKTSYGTYIQDTWKVTRKLTFDYGLRWDWEEGWHEIHNRYSSFAPSVPNPSAGGLMGATAYEGSGAGHCNCSFTKTYPWAFGPRLGIAYQIDRKTVFRAGWGLVTGTTPVLNYSNYATVGVGFNTQSFTALNFGDPALLLKGGIKPDLGYLYSATADPGIKPDPGTVNNPPTFIDPSGGRPSRLNQWNISLQREIRSNIKLEAAYVGNRGAFLQSNGLQGLNLMSLDTLTRAGLNPQSAADRALLTSTFATNAVNLAARGFKVPYAAFPTGQTLAQSLRPYPQFGSVGSTWVMRGRSWYDSLQSKVTVRAVRGLELSGAFTWQKELELAKNDVFNPSIVKDIAAQSQPLVQAYGYSYQTPALTQSRLVRNIVGGWTFSGYLRYASGLPISSPTSTNNLSQLIFQSTNMNRVPGVPLFTKDLNCHCIDPNKDFVLNPAAWTNPDPGTWGTAANRYNDYRFQRHPVEQMGFGRVFRLPKEGMSLQIRGEFFNIFNRIQMADPSSSNPTAVQQRNAAGVPQSGFGYINALSPGNASVLDQPTNLGFSPRQGQLLMRFQW